MSVILGLHCGHDGAACIVRDGEIVVAIGAERVTGHKKHWGLCEEIIDYVLSASGLTVEQIDHVAISDYHHKFARDIITVDPPIEHYWQNLVLDDRATFTVTLRGRAIPGFHISHHLAHCASAYYTSPFQDAHCFSMDASGGRIECNSLVARGQGNKIEALYCPGLMVGCTYGSFVERLGMGPQISKAGSMMGLAAYGRVRENVEHLVAGSFVKSWTGSLEFTEAAWNELSGGSKPEDSDGRRAADIAATMQHVFERAIVRCVSAIGGGANLCLSGGSMLNCNANTAVRDECGFENVHLFPACSDDGLAVGSALYLAHHVLDEPRHVSDAYLGRSYPYAQPDVERVARAISEGKIVAWHNGRSEYGPRALGHRSLLADPRTYRSREILNFVVKKREWFRPFAPSVLAENAEEWFPGIGDSPYMLHTARVSRPTDVPAIVHVDGSARPQTVRREANPDFYDLIAAFRDITGIPMLLNTSLNGPGKTMLESDADAERFWVEHPVDMMVLQGNIRESS